MEILEIFKAIIYGIVEGITEWLPISSTGHLILLEEILPLNMTESFLNMFLVVIQLGAILAVVFMFWNKLWPFRFNEKPIIQTNIFLMWLKIVVASIPAALCIFFDDKLEELFYNYKTVSIMLILFGILFLLVENRNQSKTPSIRSISEITFQTAFLIGIFQMIAAIFPGTSRSGATIIGSLMIGLARPVAAEFTFFLAIPAMLGASFLKLLKFGFAFSGSELAILLTGMVVAFLVSLFVIKFLMGYIRKHDFKAFGWYRIALGCLVLGYFLIFK